jgi:predicted DNA-binding transcriptional regulator AlpA
MGRVCPIRKNNAMLNYLPTATRLSDYHFAIVPQNHCINQSARPRKRGPVCPFSLGRFVGRLFSFQKGVCMSELVSPNRLGDATDVAAMLKTSKRHVHRMADGGLMPWGVKIGRLRRWNLDELAAWVTDGCKPVEPKRRPRRDNPNGAAK